MKVALALGKRLASDLLKRLANFSPFFALNQQVASGLSKSLPKSLLGAENGKRLAKKINDNNGMASLASRFGAFLLYEFTTHARAHAHMWGRVFVEKTQKRLADFDASSSTTVAAQGNRP